jgi:hypothetical protein
MTRTLAAAAAAVAILASPAGAAPPATRGPFVGAVRQGDTRTYRFSDVPPGGLCPNPMTWHLVSLSNQPTTDRLTLTAAGVSATGAGGGAQVAIYGNWCTSFDISVTGTSVATAAVFTISVRQTDTV